LRAATGPGKARIRKMADLKTCSGFTVEHTTKRTKDTKDSEIVKF